MSVQGFTREAEYGSWTLEKSHLYMERGERRAWQVKCPEWILGDSNTYPEIAWQSQGLSSSYLTDYSNCRLIFCRHYFLCRHYQPFSYDRNKEAFFRSRHAAGVWVEENVRTTESSSHREFMDSWGCTGAQNFGKLRRKARKNFLLWCEKRIGI